MTSQKRGTEGYQSPATREPICTCQLTISVLPKKTELLTIDRKALHQCSRDHDTRATKDRPAATEPVVQNGYEREREDGTKRVGRSDDSLQRALGVVEDLSISTARDAGGFLQLTQDGRICMAFTICEWNPEVIWMPMQVGMSIKYKYRRFGLCTQDTLSSLASRVTRVSLWPILKNEASRRVRYLSSKAHVESGNSKQGIS